MNKDASVNPYEPSSTLSDPVDDPLTRLQSVLLTLLVIVLLLRGGFMAFAWAVQLSFGIDLNSHFYAAIFTQDVIYSITALVGAVMLIARHKIGWWAALIHWCWYIACEIVMVATGFVLGRTIPVAHEPPAMYQVMAYTFILAVSGMTVLLWRPIAVACRAPAAIRYHLATITLISAVLVSFAVNGWISMR